MEATNLTTAQADQIIIDIVAASSHPLDQYALIQAVIKSEYGLWLSDQGVDYIAYQNVIRRVLHRLVNEGKLAFKAGEVAGIIPGTYSLPPATAFVRMWDYSEEDMQDAAQPAPSEPARQIDPVKLSLDHEITTVGTHVVAIREEGYGTHSLIRVENGDDADKLEQAFNALKLEIKRLKGELAMQTAMIEH